MIDVDDITTGTDCVASAHNLQQELIKVIKQGQFELRKWFSNVATLVRTISPEHRQTQSVTFDEHESEFTNVLGLKSKVAPEKKLSIPRLELCGSLLLARLIYNLNLTSLKIHRIMAWLDSTVALSLI